MNYPFLDDIKDLKDLKKLSLKNLKNLSKEIRERIINVVSSNGGHLSSNLGIVDLTIALHYAFNSPIDHFLFDTSHQTYAHKLLTNRHKDFDTLREYKGISGFSDPKESIHDNFLQGHAGTCLSQSLGIAKSRDFENKNFHVLSILGDASLTCGLTLEALNNMPKDIKNFIVILNDNNMAISKNVGNIKNILSRLINNPFSNKLYFEFQKLLSKIPKYGSFLSNQGQKIKESLKNLISSGCFFEQFGLSYIGPVDGHNIKKMVDVFSKIKNTNKPVIVHTITQKGKGFFLAKKNPTSYHGVKPFDIENGISFSNKKTFPKIFGKFLTDLAKTNKNLIAITPAMLSGSCLDDFKKNFPNRCFDVGIAEGHCVSYAAGIAYRKKNKVVVSIYSSFLQRAFDNIFHDIALQNIPITIAIDRAGLSGKYGSTHHGIYDISYLNSLPNMIIAQPRDGHLLKELILSSFSYQKPTAIRYPNLVTDEKNMPIKKREIKKAEILQKGKNILLIPLGHMVKTAFEVSEILEKFDIFPTIVDPIFIKPLDEKLFLSLLNEHPYVATIEEHAVNSGFGSIFNTFCIKNNKKNIILNFGIPDIYIEHGSNEVLLKNLGLDSKSIAKKILKKFELTKRQNI